MAQNSPGASVPRKEGRDKVTGKALYVDDLRFDGMIYGATVRSSVPRGRIRAIRFGSAPSGKTIPWDEFTIVTAADIPGKNVIALILDDQPCLADKVVNHAEEAIVLLAHPGQIPAGRGSPRVEIEIEPLPAIFTIEESRAAIP